jgi:hypothetical protein
MIWLLGAFAPFALEVWVALFNVTTHHVPALSHPATCLLVTVKRMTVSGGDFLHGLADGLDVTAWIRVTIE